MKLAIARFVKLNTILNFLLIFLMLSGCASLRSPGGEATTAASAILLPDSAQLKAYEAEKDANYAEALDYWKQADRVIEDKIGKLSVQMKELAKKRAQDGVDCYRNQQGDKAFKAFLETLRLDPTNKVARQYLLSMFTPTKYKHYTVRKGETFASIAKGAYGSSSYGLIAKNFSRRDKGDDLKEGMVISLPILASFHRSAPVDYSKKILVARRLFKAGQFQEALDLASRLQKSYPTEEEPSYIGNMALLEISKQLVDQERFDAAIAALKRVDPRFRNVRDDIASIEKNKAAKLLTTAQSNNRQNYEQGLRLYKEGELLKAMKCYRQVDPHYPGLDKAVAATQKKIRHQADEHFKKGVKLFVNEKLTAAIAEWEETLKLDPNNESASLAIKKTRNLLKKVQQMH